MDWLIGNWQDLGTVAGKAALMYVIATLGLRGSHRRTLAQWRILDFVTAAAIGAIVGRTAIASPQSFITGAVALVSLLVVHRLASTVRLSEALRPLFDHRIRVLVQDGKLRRGQLLRCGISDDDISTHLRQQGVGELDEVKYLIYEAAGQLTLVLRDTPSTPLITSALDQSVDFQR